jgi:hypothetical protein
MLKPHQLTIKTHKIMKENQGLQVIEKQDIISSLVLNGDLSKMNANQKVDYYKNFCESLGLNPLTQPFQIIKFQGKETLYATKDATEQLRKIRKVSIVESNTTIEGNICITKVKVQDLDNRYDIATGVVVLPNDPIGKANAIMKSETKAKRRATLSICGLGILDESELETMPKYETVPISEVTTIESKKVKEEENGSQYYIELKNKVRETLGGKMNVTEAIKQLNKLTKSKFDKFPTNEEICKQLLNLICMNEVSNGN